MSPTSVLDARIVGVIALAFCTLTLSSASALVVAANAPKAPKASKGYHLDGFRGWQNGYPVGLRCAAADKACDLKARLPQPI